MHFIAKHMLQVDGVYKSSMCPSGDNNVRLAIVYINYGIFAPVERRETPQAQGPKVRM